METTKNHTSSIKEIAFQLSLNSGSEHSMSEICDGEDL